MSKDVSLQDRETPHDVTKAEATVIARASLESLKAGTEFVILDSKTVERDFGWVFFYSTKKYLETNDRRFIVPGNGPLVVRRSDGRTEYLSTSIPGQLAIEEYEKRWQEETRD